VTVTAVVIGHADRAAISRTVLALQQEQTRPPDEVIAASCCCSGPFAQTADLRVSDRHVDDWGHRLCAYGIALARCDQVWLVNCDDRYDPTFLEQVTARAADIVHCDYTTHLTGGAVMESAPEVGRITRGNNVFDRRLAQEVGYLERCYEADGLFVEALMRAGATHERVPHVLYEHR
jgi:hypothetical protein